MEGFRTLVRGWLGKVLMLVLALPFIVVGFDSYFTSTPGKDIAASVDKQYILSRELDQQVDQQHKKLLPNVGGNSDLIDDTVLQQQTLDNLIAQRVLLNQARRVGFTMTDSQIVEMLHKEPSFQQNGQFSETLFQSYLKNSGNDRITLFKTIHDEMSLGLIVRGISNSSLSGGAEIDRIIKLQTEKRNVQLSMVLASSYLPQVNVTDAQVANYFNANKKNLNSIEQVDVDYVVLDSSSLAKQIKATDQDLQARYQSIVQAAAGKEQRHVQHILVATDKIGDAAAKKKIDSLAAQVKAGSDFGELAKAHSDDQVSAVNNGDLGFVERGIYGAEFDTALDALKPNEVSKPIKTQFGYDLIKLLDIKKTAVPSFESLRGQLMIEATQLKLDTAYTDAQSQINEQAASSDSLVDVARINNLSISRSGLMSRSGLAGDFSNKELLSTVFSVESIKDRKVSSGIALSPTRTIWVQAAKYLPVKPLTLVEATPQIRTTLQTQGAMAFAKAQADKITASLNSGKTIEQAAADFGVVFKDLGQVTRDKGLPSVALSDAAFSVKSPSAGRMNAKTVNVPDGVVVLAVGQVTDAVASTLPEQRAQIQSSLGTLRGQQELEDYVEHLKNGAKIEKFTVKGKSAP
jgi:peptidyl-prolyl cis-trans isomerase D